MKYKHILIILLLFKTFTSYSQDINTDYTNTTNKNFVKPLDLNVKSAQGKYFSPFKDNGLSSFISNISVSSFYNDGTDGKIQLQSKSQAWNYGLSVDQKIGKTDTKATPFSLSGISPGTTVEFNIKHQFRTHELSRLGDSDVVNLDKVVAKYALRNHVDPHSVGLKDMYENGTDEEIEDAIKAIKSFHKPVFFNLKIGATKTSFSYATDSFSLKDVNNSYLTPTFTMSLIKVLTKGFKISGYVSLSYNYSENYTAADDVTFTSPFGRTNNFYNTTLAFGAPSKSSSNNISLAYGNNFFSDKNTPKIAISPSITWDWGIKKIGAFLPLYFIRGTDKDGKLLNVLQAGVMLGYTTSTRASEFSNFKNGFSAQLIISAPLNFLNNL